MSERLPCGIDAIDWRRLSRLREAIDAARAEGRREGLEEAARVCDQESWERHVMGKFATASRACAVRIRALLAQSPPKEPSER